MTAPALRLRSACPDDAPLLAAWWAEPEVRRHQPFERTSEEEIRHDLASLDPPHRLRQGLGDRFQWIVEVGGEPAGWISLHLGSRLSFNAELAYSLSTSFQRRGLMVRALRALLKTLGAATRLQRLEVLCTVDNYGSRRVAESLGFRLVKTLPGHVKVRGEPRDCRLYALDDLRSVAEGSSRTRSLIMNRVP